MKWLWAILLLPTLAFGEVDSVRNFIKADVVGVYSATDTLIIVDSAAAVKMPVSGFSLVWWNVEDYPDPSDDPNVEIVTVQNRTEDTLDVLRGQDGTSASTKNTAGQTYRVIQGATAGLFDAIRAALATKLAGTDTVSLSNRINLKLAASDTASLSARINLKADTASVLFWADTSILATQSDISDFMIHGDTASLSSRINAKLTAPDTTGVDAGKVLEYDGDGTFSWGTDDGGAAGVGILDSVKAAYGIDVAMTGDSVATVSVDTAEIATQYDLTQVAGVDTTSLSNRINAKIALSDSMKWILRQDSLLRDPTGFYDRLSTITFTDADHEFKIVGPFDVYAAGVKYSKTSDSITVDSTSGLHYIYYDSLGVLNQGTDAWTINSRNAPVATVYYNEVTAKGILSDERHGFMPGIVQEYFHETAGSKFVSGMAVGVSLTGDTIRVGSGEWYDDDIEFLPAVQESLMLFYRTGTDWDWVGPQRMYFDTLVNVPAYDNAGTRTAVGVAKYSHTWVFMTNNVNYPLVAIMGQGEYNTAALAEAVTPSSLSLGDLPTKEALLLYRITWQRNGSEITWIQTTDYRSQSGGQAINYVASDHTALSNLDFASSGHTGFLGWTDTTATVATLYDISLKADTSAVLFWADTNVIATQSDISDFMVHGDTASLSARIDLKLNSAAIDTSKVLFWADTSTNIATNYDISDFMIHGDTASLSSRIDAKAPSASPTFSGTVTVGSLAGTVRATAGALSATASDTVGLAAALDAKLPASQRAKFNAPGAAVVYDSLRFVNGSNIAITNSGNAFTVAVSGVVTTSTDSLNHKFVDSTGRTQTTLSKLAAVVYNTDSLKYKSLLVSSLDTTGVATAGTGVDKELYINNALATKMRTRYQYWSMTLDSSMIQVGEQIAIAWLGAAVQIDSAVCVGEGTTNFTFNVHYGDRNAVTDSLFDAVQTANSTTTGNKLATNDGDLSYGQFMWVKIIAITTKPTEWHITLKGRLR